MTLSDMLADLYRRLNYASSPDSAVTTRLTALLNETQAEILSEPGMASLLRGQLTFASVASTPEYSLPQGADRVRAIYETTNDIRLTPMSFDAYRSAFPDVTAVTGTSESYVDLGHTNIDTQPSAATEVFIDSTSASDNTQTAYVEGYRTGGYFRALSVAMAGTTGTSLGSAIADWVYITKFYISAAAVGTVTLQTTAVGGTTLATIPIGATYPRYRRIALVPTPASAITYTVEFDWNPSNLAVSTDEPVLPPRFHRLLPLGARMKEYEKKDDSRYGDVAQQYQHGINQLKWYIHQQAVGLPNLRGPMNRGLSQLGPYYPVGS